MGDLDACKGKCLDFKDDCKYIIHGWTNQKTKKESLWCTVATSEEPCKPLLNGPNDCGAGGGDNGVHSYEWKSGIL